VNNLSFSCRADFLFAFQENLSYFGWTLGMNKGSAKKTEVYLFWFFNFYSQHITLCHGMYVTAKKRLATTW